MASGVRWDETYTNPQSDRRHMLDLQIAQKPGVIVKYMASLQRESAPGTVWKYNTGDTHIAGALIRAAVKRPVAEYLFEKIWAKFGMEDDASWWLESPDGLEVGGSGFSATLRDYGRFGQFVLDGGRKSGERTGRSTRLVFGSGEFKNNRWESTGLRLHVVDLWFCGRSGSSGCVLRSRNLWPVYLRQPPRARSYRCVECQAEAFRSRNDNHQ